METTILNNTFLHYIQHDLVRHGLYIHFLIPLIENPIFQVTLPVFY
jgi:hypothetical protein